MQVLLHVTFIDQQWHAIFKSNFYLYNVPICSQTARKIASMWYLSKVIYFLKGTAQSTNRRLSTLTMFNKSLPVSTSHLLIEWSQDAENIVSGSDQFTDDTHCVWPTSVETASP